VNDGKLADWIGLELRKLHAQWVESDRREQRDARRRAAFGLIALLVTLGGCSQASRPATDPEREAAARACIPLVGGEVWVCEGAGMRCAVTQGIAALDSSAVGVSCVPLVGAEAAPGARPAGEARR
jgi:hypothetical protein